MEKKMGEGTNRTRLEVEGLWSRGKRGVNGKGSGSWDGRGVDWEVDENGKGWAAETDWRQGKLKRMDISIGGEQEWTGRVVHGRKWNWAGYGKRKWKWLHETWSVDR